MASPPPGLTPQQTQQWATGFQGQLRQQGQDPAMFGFRPQPNSASMSQPDQDAQRRTSPFNERWGQGMWAYSRQAPSPGQAQPQQSPYANSTPYAAYAPTNTGMNQQQRDQAMTAWTMPKQQLLQWGQSMPQPFGLAPQQGMAPDQSWNAIANVIGQVNNTAANQQVGTYLGAGAPPAGWGQTSYDPQAMWGGAMQATQQGWENPFTPFAGYPAPPPPPPRLPSSGKTPFHPSASNPTPAAPQPRLPTPGMAQPIPPQVPEPPSTQQPPAPDLTRYERTAEELSRAARGPRATQSDQQRAAAAQRDLQEARGYADILATDGEGSQRMNQFRQASQQRDSREWREREARLGQSVYPQQQPDGPGPATRRWNQIERTTNTQTKALSPAHQRAWDAMVAETRAAAGQGTAWPASGSPLADYARAKKASLAPASAQMLPPPPPEAGSSSSQPWWAVGGDKSKKPAGVVDETGMPGAWGPPSPAGQEYQSPPAQPSTSGDGGELQRVQARNRNELEAKRQSLESIRQDMYRLMSERDRLPYGSHRRDSLSSQIDAMQDRLTATGGARWF